MESSLKDFANAVREMLDLEPLPEHKKEAAPYKTVEQRDLERFYVPEIVEATLTPWGNPEGTQFASRRRG